MIENGVERNKDIIEVREEKGGSFRKEWALTFVRELKGLVVFSFTSHILGTLLLGCHAHTAETDSTVTHTQLHSHLCTPLPSSRFLYTQRNQLRCHTYTFFHLHFHINNPLPPFNFCQLICTYRTGLWQFLEVFPWRLLFAWVSSSCRKVHSLCTKHNPRR